MAIMRYCHLFSYIHYRSYGGKLTPKLDTLNLEVEQCPSVFYLVIYPRSIFPAQFFNFCPIKGTFLSTPVLIRKLN